MPAPATIDDRFVSARLNFLTGRLLVAADEAEALIDEAIREARAPIAVEAALLASQCRLMVGAFDAAIAILERLSPKDATAAARCEGCLGVALLVAGEAKRARALGLAIYDVAARVVRCDALLAAGRDEELRAAAGEMEKMARRFPSPRFIETARFYRAVSATEVPDPAVLERFATLADTAPAVAARARALLGEEARLDAVDRAVVGAIRERAGGFMIERIGDVAGGSGGWGVDEPRFRVWLAGERFVDLSKKRLLFKILRILCDHGGVATKETIVRGAWGRTDYHPLRDDKRLQVAIRELRGLIEDDPANPTRVITTETGYGLGESARRLVRARRDA